MLVKFIQKITRNAKWIWNKLEKDTIYVETFEYVKFPALTIKFTNLLKP